MQNYAVKFKLLCLPFLLCMVGLTVFYTFLNWLLVIQLDWITINPMIIEFALPIVGALLLVFLIMRKQIRLFSFKNGKSSDFLYFVMIIGMAVPVIIAQNYIVTATGKLTPLRDITQIDSLPKTKYYQLDRYYFYKNAVSTNTRFSTSGKNDQYFDFTLYCVQPILKTARDTIKESTHYWLCNKYNGQVSNNLSPQEKEAAYKEFVIQSESTFRLTTFNFSYLERIAYSTDAEFYGHAASQSKLLRDGQDILLIIHQDPFSERNGKSFQWIFFSMGIVLAILLLILLACQLKTASELNKDKKRIEREKARGWRKNYEWLLPNDGFYITPLLLYANVLVYLLMVICGLGLFRFDGPDLFNWGALLRSAVQNGDWWRMLTAVFLHGGIMHIANNMLSLYFIGFMLEPILGRWRYLIIYLICGLGGSFASIYWHENTLSVGASGAIFGLYGFMLALILMKVFEPELNKLFLGIAGIFVGINLIMGLAGNVDNAAHIGGIISGIVIGYLFLPGLKKNKSLNEQTDTA